ncbi:MAG: hypothetical protein JWQ18_2836 [Conexibacter sp.]|nr:hypothetical protein [Conexibacter sp.]
MLGMSRAAALAASAALACALTGTATAQAASQSQVVSLGGSPFNVYVGDRGQMQGFLDGQSAGVFYSPRELAGDAGFFLAFPDSDSTLAPGEVKGSVYGFDGHAGPHEVLEYDPLGQGPVTGSGTAADPKTQVTRYAVSDDDGEVAEVAQTTTYVNGEGRYRVGWSVTNRTPDPLNFRAFAAADFYYDGDDYGTGVFMPGPPRFVGGTNTDTGRSGGFEEASSAASPPWTAYEGLRYGNNGPDEDDPADWERQIWWIIDNAGQDDLDVGLDDQVVGDRVDNAGAVQWDQYRTTALAPGQTASFALVVRAAIPAALLLTPTASSTPQAVPLAIAVTSLDTDGRPFIGKTLHWTVAGANPGAGQLALTASGTATITDPAANLGGDTVTAYVDLNNDGAQQPNEPTAAVGVTVVDVTPPVCTAAVGPGKPGGSGRRRLPVTLTVSCNEAANLTATGRLSFSVRKLVRHARGHRKAKYKTVVQTVVLPVGTGLVSPGAAAGIPLLIPAAAAKKYTHHKTTITLTGGAADAAGNATNLAATKRLTLANYKVAAPKKKAKKKKQ